jgi:hypothetical protein
VAVVLVGLFILLAAVVAVIASERIILRWTARRMA